MNLARRRTAGTIGPPSARRSVIEISLRYYRAATISSTQEQDIFHVTLLINFCCSLMTVGEHDALDFALDHHLFDFRNRLGW